MKQYGALSASGRHAIASVLAVPLETDRFPLFRFARRHVLGIIWAHPCAVGVKGVHEAHPRAATEGVLHDGRLRPYSVAGRYQ